jgi:hypothetical protein
MTKTSSGIPILDDEKQLEEMRQVFAPDKPADLQSETSSTSNNQTNKHNNNKSRVPTLLRNDRATKLHPAISVHSPGEVVKAIFFTIQIYI